MKNFVQNSLRDIPILTYHKIDARLEWGVNTLAPHRFREQMQFLKSEGYQTINFAGLDHLLPEKSLIITFDDGYESVYHHALPVLEEMGFTAVVFIITGFIGRKNSWDANWGGITFRHMNATQIIEMAKSGYEIASHGCSHRAFTYLTPDMILQEMVSSREFLGKLTGNEISTIAYPFGLQNRGVRTIAEKTGYRYGCVNVWGGRGFKERFRLRRIPVYRIDTPAAFRRKLEGGMIHSLEVGKLAALSWSARLTPAYKKITGQYRFPLKDSQVSS